MIFTWQTIKQQKQQAPLVQLLSVKVYWQIKCHQRGQLTQEPEFLCFSLVPLGWLVVSLSSPRWPSDLCTESSTGKWKVSQVWCCFQANPLLSSHFSLFSPIHKWPSVFRPRPRSPESGYTSLRLKPRVSEMERSRKLKKWEQMNHLWIVNQTFESVACFAWIPRGAD